MRSTRDRSIKEIEKRLLDKLYSDFNEFIRELQDAVDDEFIPVDVRIDRIEESIMAVNNSVNQLSEVAGESAEVSDKIDQILEKLESLEQTIANMTTDGPSNNDSTTNDPQVTTSSTQTSVNSQLDPFITFRVSDTVTNLQANARFFRLNNPDNPDLNLTPTTLFINGQQVAPNSEVRVPREVRDILVGFADLDPNFDWATIDIVGRLRLDDEPVRFAPGYNPDLPVSMRDPYFAYPDITGVVGENYIPVPTSVINERRSGNMLIRVSDIDSFGVGSPIVDYNIIDLFFVFNRRS